MKYKHLKFYLYFVILAASFSCSSRSTMEPATISTTENKSNVVIDSLTPQLVKLGKMRPETFDPILLMSVTNGLLPLGKEEILEQLSMLYTGNEENMNGFGSFLLLRTLFNLPSNLEYPVMRIGKPDTDPPNSMERSNRFPILMVEDVPYLVITGYFSTGVPQPVAEHFQFFKEFGQLRTTPFPISTSLSKDELYNQFETEWKTVFGNSELPSTIRTSVTRQINGVLEYSER